MNDSTLTRALRALAAADRIGSDQAHTPRERLSACISLPRLREGLVREDWTPAEQSHLAECARCQASRDKLGGMLWHPEWWQLSFDVQGLLVDEDAADVTFHLRDDRCRRCLARYARLEAQFGRGGPPERLALPDYRPTRLSAENTGALFARVPASDDRLDARLFEHERRLHLAIITKAPELEGRIVGYALHSPANGRTIAGCLALRPEASWQTAEVVLDPDEVYRQLEGECVPAVTLLEPDQITDETLTHLAKMLGDGDEGARAAAREAVRRLAETAAGTPMGTRLTDLLASTQAAED
ncbi:MAG: hypothetical protein HY329_24505 [Chloroflexi bacterium]|nr:hypothetical protein [Chloroflexota bacterium]